MAVMQNIKNTKKFLLRDSKGNKSMSNFLKSGYFPDKKPKKIVTKHKRNLTEESGNLQEFRTVDTHKHN